MKPLLALLQVYRSKLVVIGLILLAPWAWMFAFVPWWVSLAGLALVLPAALAFIYFVLPAPQAPRRSSDGEDITNEEIARMRETCTGMNELLAEWLSVSHKTETSLEDLKRQLHEVITDTESSVIDISNSFRAITGKTRTQMDYAMGLLQTKQEGEDADFDGDAVAKWLSLPDYIRAYEELLNSITERLMRFSAGSLDMVKQQGKVRESAVMVVDLLDEVRSMARQISMLALSSSVSAGGISHQKEFVEMADKIRDISDNANDLNRRIREYLDSIRDEMSATHGAMNKMADEAREAAKQAKADVAQLTVTMMMKTQEVAQTLERINALGQEIEQDINNIIMAMQFQDINQQKLERLKGPVLNEVTGTIRTIADETSVLSKKLNLRVGGPRVGTVKPFRVVAKPPAQPAAPVAASGDGTTEAKPQPDRARDKGKQPRTGGSGDADGGDSQVELF